MKNIFGFNNKFARNKLVTAMALAQNEFNPRSAFAGGEQGIWLDPNDLDAAKLRWAQANAGNPNFNSLFMQAFPNHALFQDSAGTTPVTAAGQPVGLVLDKRLGLVQSSELVVNGDFSSASGWTLGSGTTISGGTLNMATVTNTGALRSITIQANTWVIVRASVLSRTAGRVRFRLLNSGVEVANSGFINTTGDKLFYLYNTNANQVQVDPEFGVGFTGSVDNVSVRELPGNHAFQSTSISRPVLRQTPILGNELVVNGDFSSDTWWVKEQGWSISSGIATKPGSEVFALKTPNNTVVAGKTYAVTFTALTSGIFNVMFGSSYITAGSGVGTRTVLGTVTATTSIGFQGGSAISLDNISIREVTGYYTDRNYLEFDGVDDFLVTNNIDFTGTDQVSVFAGVRKLSDAAIGMLVELSVSGTANVGSFTMAASPNVGTGEFNWRARGSLDNVFNVGGYYAPISAVLSGSSDISTDYSVLRVNGKVAGSNYADSGTGNYGNYPLYIGRRGGTSLPFNGWLYGLLIKGALSSTAETARIEKMLLEKISESISYEPTLALNFLDQRYSIKV